jgi:hypothetical protein
VEFHNGELDAIGRGTVDAVSRQLTFDFDFIANQRLMDGYAVRRTGLTACRGDNGNVSEGGELFVYRGQTGRENSIVVGQKYLHKRFPLLNGISFRVDFNDLSPLCQLT